MSQAVNESSGRDHGLSAVIPLRVERLDLAQASDQMEFSGTAKRNVSKFLVLHVVHYKISYERSKE
jgi:hypothetical protein